VKTTVLTGLLALTCAVFIQACNETTCERCIVQDAEEGAFISDAFADAQPEGEQTPGAATTLTADQAHRPQELNDFLRVTFLPVGTEPSTQMGLPSAAFVFSGPATYFKPTMKLKDIPQYFGLTNRDDRTLVAMRCTPSDSLTLSPVLATWPNVFKLITADLGATYSCPPEGESPENNLYCLVKDYDDATDAVVAVSLRNVLTLAATLFADEGIKGVFKTRYGIYPEFSGLGYAVKTYGNYDPMNAAIVLDRSIVPEYLVKNRTLEDAGCKCIKVPPYDGRGDDPLDMDFIRDHGTTECIQIETLTSSF